MAKLGQDFDIIPAVTPVNLAAGASTGARLHLRNYEGACIVFYKATGGAAEAPTITIQEHNAATAGTSQNLVVVDSFHKKEEATLDGDETWTAVTQTAAATVTDADWDDANEVLVAIQVEATELSDGFEWISANVDDPGVTSQVAAVLYVAYGLNIQRKPENLANPNA